MLMPFGRTLTASTVNPSSEKTRGAISLVAPLAQSKMSFKAAFWFTAPTSPPAFNDRQLLRKSP
jgi:hypothetical protein